MATLWVLWLACIGLLVGAADTDQRCPVFTDFTDFPTDEGHLSDHWLLLPAGCESLAAMLPSLENALGPRRVAMVDNVLAQNFNLAGTNCPRAACVDRGTPLRVLHGGLRRWDPIDQSADGLLEWVMNNCQAAHVGFVNLDSQNFTIVWKHKSWTDEVPLPAGGRNASVSFYHNDKWFELELGTPYEILDEQGEVYREGTAEFSGVHVLGESPDFDPNMYKRDWATLQNHTHELELLRAGNVQKAYTETGSRRVDAPSVVWASVAAYYHNNRHSHFREGWQPATDRAYVNFWEAPVRIIQLPPKLKRTWQFQLMDMVSAWAGGVELEPTDLYGIRIYARGATLLPHVDRESTHALSLVMNVAQFGIDEPWPLEVNDMKGNPDSLRDVNLNPGQLALYESARCLHSRMKPLQGIYYANLFGHFRPKNNPDWWRSKTAVKSPRIITQKGGARTQFELVNSDPNGRALKLIWQSDAGKYEPMETIPPGKSMIINSFAKHHFKLRGACRDELTVFEGMGRLEACAEGAPPLASLVQGPPPPVAPGLQTKFSVESLIESRIGLYWITPSGETSAEAVSFAEPFQVATVNTRTGHKFELRSDDGSCKEVKEVTDLAENYPACAESITPEQHQKRVHSQITTFSKMRPVKIVNLSNRTLAVFQDHGSKGNYQHRVQAGSVYSLSSYDTHKFCLVLEPTDGTEKGDDGPGCAARVGSITVAHDVYLHTFDPRAPALGPDERPTEGGVVVHALPEGEEMGLASAAVLADWDAEVEMSAAYKAREGKHWVVHPKRKPPVLPMRPAEQIGDVIKITTEDDPPRELEMKVASTAPRVFVIKDFLSAEEATGLIDIGKNNIVRSTTMSRVSASRTSKNTWIYRDTSNVTESLYRRAAIVLGMDEAKLQDRGADNDETTIRCSEPIQLVHYSPGQKYDAHFDWSVSFPDTRFATLLLYLNEPEMGGATAFPSTINSMEEPLVLHPGKGGAVLFYNLLPDGNADVNSLHAALPVIKGEKWLANFWVWDAKRGSLGNA